MFIRCQCCAHLGSNDPVDLVGKLSGARLILTCTFRDSQPTRGKTETTAAHKLSFVF